MEFEILHGMRSNKGEEYCKRSMISMRYLILITAHALLKGFKISNFGSSYP
jgi:hypothetical protein